MLDAVWRKLLCLLKKKKAALWQPGSTEVRRYCTLQTEVQGKQEDVKMQEERGGNLLLRGRYSKFLKDIASVLCEHGACPIAGLGSDVFSTLLSMTVQLHGQQHKG